MAGWNWPGGSGTGVDPLLLLRIEWKVDQLMANLDALRAASEQITSAVASAISTLDDLSNRVGNGDSISQADLDAITDQLTSANVQLNDAVAADDQDPNTVASDGRGGPDAPPDVTGTPPDDTGTDDTGGTPPADTGGDEPPPGTDFGGGG